MPLFGRSFIRVCQCPLSTHLDILPASLDCTAFCRLLVWLLGRWIGLANLLRTLIWGILSQPKILRTNGHSLTIIPWSPLKEGHLREDDVTTTVTCQARAESLKILSSYRGDGANFAFWLAAIRKYEVGCIIVVVQSSLSISRTSCTCRWCCSTAIKYSSDER